MKKLSVAFDVAFVAQQRNWFTWEYSELKPNKINCPICLNFSQSSILVLKSVRQPRNIWIAPGEDIYRNRCKSAFHKGVDSCFKCTKYHINVQSTNMVAIKLWTFHFYAIHVLEQWNKTTFLWLNLHENKRKNWPPFDIPSGSANLLLINYCELTHFLFPPSPKFCLLAASI